MAARPDLDSDPLFAGAPVAMAFLDRDLRYRRVNEALAALNGRTVADHLGRHISEVLPVDLARFAVAQIERVLATGEPLLDFRYNASPPNGARQLGHYVASFYPVRGAQGGPAGVGMVIVDATALRDAQQHAERLQALTAALAEVARPADIARIVVEQAMQAVGAQAGAVFQLDPSLGDLELVYAAGHPGGRFERPERLSIDAPVPAGEAVRTGRPVVIESSAQLERRYTTLGASSPAGADEAIVALPLIIDAGILGVVSLSFSEPRRFERAALDFLENIAQQCAQAMERARLRVAERGAAARLRALAEIARMLGQVTDEAALLRATAEQVSRALGPLCIIALDTEAGIAAHAHHPDDAVRRRVLDAYARTPTGRGGLVGAVLATGRTLKLGEGEPAALDDRLALEEAAVFASLGVRAAIAVPLCAADAPIGVVIVGRQTGPLYGVEDQLLLEELAGRAAMALSRIRRRVQDEAQRARLELVEERLRVALAGGDIGIWDWRPPSGEVAWDARARQLFGLPSRTPVTHADVVRAMHPDDRPRVQAAVEAALAGGSGGSYDVEYRTVGVEDGVERWIRATGTVFFDGTGKAERFCGAVVDVTPAVRARQAVEAANKAKDEFLAMLGHELRNPLSPILTSLQLMKLRADERFDKERAIIERQVQHMVRLVDDLLDVSRITRGKIELKKRPLELAAVVAKAIEVASPLLEDRMHRLTTRVAPRGLAIHGDEHRLTQVIANLLTNAAKYTPYGGSIEITGERVGGEVRLTVTDNGTGIAPDLLPRVFETFVQGARTPERGQGGLGLGLSIVRSLIELHGGSVRAASAGTGRGSAFTVSLPAHGEATAAVDTAAGPAVSKLAADAQRRVLVVDDNVDAADSLAEALRMVGHDVRVAFDGPGALAAFEQHRPHVVFLDIGLPAMDGYEVARRIRQLTAGPDALLIAVSGYGQDADRRRSIDSGFDEHLVKPVELERTLAIAGGEVQLELRG